LLSRCQPSHVLLLLAQRLPHCNIVRRTLPDLRPTHTLPRPIWAPEAPRTRDRFGQE
jgi:hypothetical protein